jgi:hypothetical protein
MVPALTLAIWPDVMVPVIDVAATEAICELVIVP